LGDLNEEFSKNAIPRARVSIHDAALECLG